MSIQSVGYPNIYQNKPYFGNSFAQMGFPAQNNQNIQQPAQDAFVKEKSNVNTKKVLTGLGIAAVIGGAAYLAFRGKIGAARQEVTKLAEHIEFKPAQTVEEAIQFGKQKLGIKEYVDFDNHEVVNWINEGLVNVSNATKGKVKMPNIVHYSDDKSYLAAIAPDVQGYSILHINKDFIKNINNTLKEFSEGLIKIGCASKSNGAFKVSKQIKSTDHSNELEMLLNAFHSNKLDLNDKLKLYDTLRNVHSAKEAFFHSPLSKIEQIVNNKLIKETLEKSKLKFDVNKIAKLSVEKQRKVLKHLLSKLVRGNLVMRYQSGSSTSTITHEMGHLQHFSSVGKNKFYSMCKEEECIANLSKISDITKDFLSSKEKQQLAGRVSHYAVESPLEFVAETYHKLINKEKIADDIMALYKQYGGPLV